MFNDFETCFGDKSTSPILDFGSIKNLEDLKDSREITKRPIDDVNERKKKSRFSTSDLPTIKKHKKKLNTIQHGEEIIYQPAQVLIDLSIFI
jgi:hypothetical protein